ncbi:MAG: hypothetical protein HY720_10855 [Planctomycetes bacterium]|nr:hypothetical protein [Planctomycetota bacterium]
MSGGMARNLSLAVVLCLAGSGAAAQEDAVLDLIGIDVDRRSATEQYLRISLRTNLPRDTRIVMEVSYEGRPVTYLWGATYLSESQDGTAQILVGPLEKGVLSGKYEFHLMVDPREQNPEMVEFWSRVPGRIDRKLEHRIGDPAEEEAARARLRDEILSIVRPVDAAVEEVLKSEAEYNQKKKFFRGETFEAQAFLAWTQTVRAPIDRLKAYYEEKAQDTHIVYYAAVFSDDLPSLCAHARRVCIAETIVPILQREGVPIPEELATEERRVMAPKSEILRMLRVDFKELYRRLDKSQALPALSSMIPGEADLPAGWVLGPVPPALQEALERNPALHEPLTPVVAARLAPYTGWDTLPPGARVEALAYCLTRAGDKEGLAEGAGWVLAIFYRIPGSPIPELPPVEGGTGPGPGGIPLGEGPPRGGPQDGASPEAKGRMFASLDTIAWLHASPGDTAAANARDALDKFLVERFGFKPVKRDGG